MGVAIAEASGWTPERLLALPEDRADLVFPEPSLLEKTFRALARRLHPDAGGSADAFARLTALRDAARAALAGRPSWTGADGRPRRAGLRRLPEAPARWVGGGWLVADLGDDGADLAEAGRRTLRGLRFADARMAKEIGPWVPEAAEGAGGLIATPLPGHLVAVEDLLRPAGRVGPRHVAWIVSSILTLCCYLGHRRLVHGGLDGWSLWVDAPAHRVRLAGGWWHAAPQGGRLLSLPAEAAARLPPALLSRAEAVARIDLEAVRAIARRLLGGAGPAPLEQWARLPGGSDPRADWRSWQAAVDAAYGPRRFVRLDPDHPLEQGD